MAAPPVEILFRVGGISDVKAAIGSVEASLDRMSRAGVRSTQAGARQRVSAEERAAKESVRIQTRAASEADREARRSATAREKAAKDTAKAQERIARETARAEERASRERIQATEKAERAIRAEHERTHREAERRARAGLSRYGGAVSRGAGRVMGAVGMAAGLVGAVGGGFAIADSLRAGVSDEAAAGKIIRGSASGAQGVTREMLVNESRATAIATGGTATDVLAGVDQFVRKVGDLAAARDIMRDLAELSAATGAGLEDMASTAAEVFTQTGNAKTTMGVMRDIAGMGRAGAVDVRDLGQYGARLTALSAMTAGDTRRNIRSAAAVAQLAKRYGGATDAAEATEAVAAMGADLREHSDKFKKLGVNVFADKGRTKIRNIEDIISETVEKSKGDISRIGDVSGMRSVKAFIGAQAAYANAGGGAAGMSALRREFSTLNATSLSEGEVKSGTASRLAENEAKINAATERFRAAINDKLLPVLPPLVDAFARIAPVVADALRFFADHPFAGLGGLVAASIVAEVAKAAIGQAVGNALVAAIARITAGQAAGGAAGGAANALLGGGGALGTAGRVALVGGAGVAGAVGLGLALGTGAAAFGSMKAEEDATARRRATPANAGEAVLRGNRDFSSLMAPRDAVGNPVDPFARPLQLGASTGVVSAGIGKATADASRGMSEAGKASAELASATSGATAALDAFATKLGTTKADPSNPSRQPAP